MNPVLKHPRAFTTHELATALAAHQEPAVRELAARALNAPDMRIDYQHASELVKCTQPNRGPCPLPAVP